jgi:hypothetical protein
MLGSALLIDHAVGAQHQRRRNRKTQGLGRLQIDDEVVLGRLLDGEIGGLRATQNPVDEVGGARTDLLRFWGVR